VALDPQYIENFVDGCLERIGEDDLEEERLFQDLFGRCHQFLLRYRYMVSGANTATSSPEVSSTQPI
jgi:hypothetical protein